MERNFAPRDVRIQILNVLSKTRDVLHIFELFISGNDEVSRFFQQTRYAKLSDRKSIFKDV